MQSTHNNTNSSYLDQFLEQKIAKLAKDFPEFGKKILNKFYLDSNYTNVNHGSYGCSPISVFQKYQQYQRELEFNPEREIRFASLEKSNKVLKQIAIYLDCDAENLVFIENASDGLNAVLKSLFAKSDLNHVNASSSDKVLIFDIAYSNTKSIIQYLMDNFALKKIEFSISEEILNFNLFNSYNEKENFDSQNINDINENNIFSESSQSKEAASEANNLLLNNNKSKTFNFNNNLKLSDGVNLNLHMQNKNLFFQNTFNKTRFLTLFEEFITENLPIRAAVIDHISSTPAITFPAKEIAEILKKHKIISIIDGAHTVGQIDLSMRSINADFYISNFYKWFYAPKSASFLYINPSLQNITHPNIITSHYKKGFKDEFLFTGTRDHSVYYSLQDALEFRTNLGGDEQIKYYCRTLAYLAGMKISLIWNTGLLAYDPDLNANMVNVLIPCDGIGFVCRSVEFVAKVAKETFDIYNTYVATLKFSNGKFYARFSANIYNELSDYVYAAEKFLEVLRTNEKKEVSERSIEK